jgi:hypothetical protein
VTLADRAPGISGLDVAVNPAREGLPYWILWLLVSIILLLIFYIFLRDKDLRLRLSFFLAGTKRRMLRLRLQVKLKKERAKKIEIWKELGRTAWSEDVRAEGTAEIFEILKVLGEDLDAAQAEWHEAYTKIEALEKEADQTEAWKSANREWQMKKEAVQDRIIRIKKSSEPMYENLGRILDQNRPEHERLAIGYFQIDRADQTIRDLQARIESLM